MYRFVIHTLESTPEKARPILEKVEDDLGYVPNLFGVMSDAPAALDGYLTLDRRFHDTSLTPLQRIVVLLTASRANDCDYCIAAHTAELNEAGFPEGQIERIRDGESLDDGKLEALRRFTHTVVDSRGHVSEDEIEKFLEAGFDRPQVLEVILGVSMKTLSNYVNHVADTPLDERIAEFSWSRETAGEDRTTVAAKA